MEGEWRLDMDRFSAFYMYVMPSSQNKGSNSHGIVCPSLHYIGVWKQTAFCALCTIIRECIVRVRSSIFILCKLLTCRTSYCNILMTSVLFSCDTNLVKKFGNQ